VVNPDLLSFVRKDELPEKFVNVVHEFADHFKSPREYVPDFCTILTRSWRWNHSTLQDKLTTCLERFGKHSGRKKITEMIRRAFSLCENDDELKILRGALLEALVIGCHGGVQTLSSPNVGWGAQVILRNNIIRYRCTKKIDDNCRNRSTVDFGIWDGYHGKFFECKVHPDGIGCKEINYLETLSQTLKENNISHELFLVCAESIDSIRQRADILGLGLKFKLIGTKELQRMVAS